MFLQKYCSCTNLCRFMKVDIIIPAYNCEKTIGISIDSILKQNHFVGKIIIIDDCSTDKTRDVILEFQKTVDFILYKQNPQNLGAGNSRNIGLKLSTSRYISFLDSDDYWLEGHLMKLLDSLKKNKWAIFAYSNYRFFLPKLNKFSNCSEFNDRHNYKLQLRSSLISTPSVLIDKKRAGDFSFISRRTGQDYALWLSLLKKGDACGINSCTVVVQKTDNSLSKNKFQSLLDVYQIQRREEGFNILYSMMNTLIFTMNFFKKKVNFWLVRK